MFCNAHTRRGWEEGNGGGGGIFSSHFGRLSRVEGERKMEKEKK